MDDQRKIRETLLEIFWVRKGVVSRAKMMPTYYMTRKAGN